MNLRRRSALLILCAVIGIQVKAQSTRVVGKQGKSSSVVNVAPDQRPPSSDNTSTVAFSTPLRIETSPAAAPTLQPWWQSPVVISAFIAATGTVFNLGIVMFFNLASLRQRERELGTTLKQKSDELREVLTQKDTEVRLTNHQKNIDEERRTLYKQLNEFYGPMQQLLNVSKEITAAFKAGRQFRTLVELLQGSSYSGNDAVLLNEIMAVTAQVENLIMTRSGLVSDFGLRETLSRAVSHFRILKLASSGALSGQVERFEGYVFPQQLEAKIDEAIGKIHARLVELRQPHGGERSARHEYTRG